MKTPMVSNGAVWLRRGPGMLALALATTLLSGCAAALLTGGAAAGAGTIAYIKGDLQVAEAVGMDQAWDATLEGLKELELKVAQQEKDAISAKALATGAEGKKIKVTLQRVTEGMTRIRIRVGVFGNEKTSRLVLEKIRGALQ